VFRRRFGKQGESRGKAVINGLGTKAESKVIGKDCVLLQNLAEDAAETKTLAEAHPNVLHRLANLHSAWPAEVEKWLGRLTPAGGAG
jgi:hypothetical protein